MDIGRQEHAVQSTGTVGRLDLDESGFMQDPDRWNKSAARILADMYGVGTLGPDHWAIIYYLREHHLTYGSLPPMSQVCRTHGLDRGAVQRLFGGCLQAWRVSGLPDPGEEAKTYMT
jgi:tRNA 2-thiouridine synthesizing protein E